MSRTWNALERRVLGSLVEKAQTQPDYYPMTLTALTAACNQKSNRNPVMNLGEDEVQATLEGLRQQGLVSVVVPPPGARTLRYKHEIGAATGWGARQRAIMTELMLRGPQTIGELRTRCARLFEFEDLEAVTTALESLSQDDPPTVAVLPRVPGQSTVRYTHLLYPEDEQPAITAEMPSALVAPSASPSGGAVVEAMQAQIDELQEQTAELRQELNDVNTRLSRIEQQLL